MTPSLQSYGQAIELACRTIDRYDPELLADVDFYLLTAGSFRQLDRLLFHRANAELLADPESRAAKFFTTLRAGIIDVHCQGGDLS